MKIQKINFFLEDKFYYRQNSENPNYYKGIKATPNRTYQTHSEPTSIQQKKHQQKALLQDVNVTTQNFKNAYLTVK